MFRLRISAWSNTVHSVNYHTFDTMFNKKSSTLNRFTYSLRQVRKVKRVTGGCCMFVHTLISLTQTLNGFQLDKIYRADLFWAIRVT